MDRNTSFKLVPPIRGIRKILSLMFVVKDGWRSFLIIGVGSVKAVVAGRRRKKQLLVLWGNACVVFVERDGYSFLYFRSGSCIQIVLSYRLQWSCRVFRTDQ